MDLGSANGQQPRETSLSPPSDGRLLVKWMESQPETIQSRTGGEKLDDLLDKAAQPRHASGNACIKLCYYIEQCRDSKSSCLRDLVFSEKSCMAVFNFFLEWNEKNQNRSMRQVLELLSSMISLNPSKEISAFVKVNILQSIMSILTHKAAQPLVKPAFKSLECILAKGTISSEDLIKSYNDLKIRTDPEMGDLAQWDSLVSVMFGWLALADIAPAAGKCLVTLFLHLKKPTSDPSDPLGDHNTLWQRWIRQGLANNPEALDNVKNYLFPSIFKLDRSGSLSFLQHLIKHRSMSDFTTQEAGAHFLLQLSAIEVGKKAGLVEERSTIQFHKASKKPPGSVTLQEDVYGSLLAHAAAPVRSLAYSVLVSSSSPIIPFNPSTLDLLRIHMGDLYADTDAKFRNEVLSNTKHLIERLRGASAFLTREVQLLSYSNGADHPPTNIESQDRPNEIKKLLQRHELFVKWYMQLLLKELIPTSSYQRHITALKSIALILKSGILEQGVPATATQTPNHATIWPYTFNFFTSGAVRLLLDLLINPFEDVRSNAAVILKSALSDNFATPETATYLGDIKPKLKILHGDSLEPTSNTMSTKNAVAVKLKSTTILTEFITRAIQVSKRTGRADYADGVARCYGLLYSLLPTIGNRLDLVGNIIDDLACKVAIAEQDLSKAVLDAPIHGNFASLSFIWEAMDHLWDWQDDDSKTESRNYKRWDSYHRNIYLLCSRVWSAVKDVLCNDSPEGHLPKDLDELDTKDTKDVLSYSFRAVHESSNLMRNVASKLASVRRDGTPFLGIDVFIGIGNLTFDQLSSLRHRGAFSTVSLTFAKCCQLTQGQIFKSGSLGSNPLEKWYQGALTCISEQTSTTRRSAGIPALMTGIMSANSQTPKFEDMMTDLISLARMSVQRSETDQTNLPQVHAMNCLKEIFKSSTLGKRSEGRLAECLELAASSLNSEIWAMRNCALLLLRSLIDCLFGTSESKIVTEAGWGGKSIKLSYERYPSLPELLLKLLEIDTNNSECSSAPVIGAVESVFPALDIIRRAGPPATHREEIYRCVAMHLGSWLWHVREIAARTICTMMLHDGWLAALMELMSSSSPISTNRLHGVLMTVKFVLERRLALDPASATDGLREIASVLKSPASESFFESGNPEILAAYLELANTIGKTILIQQEILTDEVSATCQEIIEQLFTDNPFEEFTSLAERHLQKIQSTGGYSSDLYAALGNSIARRAIYSTALEDDPRGLKNVLTVVAALNIDNGLAALECLPQAWEQNMSRAALMGIPKAYLALLEATDSPEIRSMALSALAEALDRQFQYVLEPKSDENCLEVDRSFQFDTEGLRSVLESRKDTPSLSNAKIRISGCILLSEYVSQRGIDSEMQRYRPYLEQWGESVCLAGNSNNDFETRLAAAETMASLYGNRHFGNAVIGDECALQSLFALYDSLNDDDDEIRDLSAKTSSSLLKKSLLPLAASKELAEYIHAQYEKTPLYASNVVCRMTGNDSLAFQFDPTHLLFPSPVTQFTKAMKEDDSLFIEEEQNLFIDEIREAKQWSDIFVNTQLDNWGEESVDIVWGRPHKILANWVLLGLKQLNSVLESTDDGPLGWISKPATFAVCMRIIVSAKAILKQQHDGLFGSGDQVIGDIVSALKDFGIIGRKMRCHERLLFEAGEIQVSSFDTSNK